MEGNFFQFFWDDTKVFFDSFDGLLLKYSNGSNLIKDGCSNPEPESTEPSMESTEASNWRGDKNLLLSRKEVF
jgi:hypothetical protein